MIGCENMGFEILILKHEVNKKPVISPDGYGK